MRCRVGGAALAVLLAGCKSPQDGASRAGTTAAAPQGPSAALSASASTSAADGAPIDIGPAAAGAARAEREAAVLSLLAGGDPAARLPGVASEDGKPLDRKLRDRLAPRASAGRLVVEKGSSTGGQLPPEVIQRIVRQSFGRFRKCYDDGLKANPELAGKVSVSFVIGRDGSVGSVAGGGDLPDKKVVDCIAKQFYTLKFPEPQGGVVKVTYPIMFSPGD